MNEDLKNLLKKKFPNSVIDFQNPEKNYLQIETISTKLANLDWVLGGGVPFGRLIEIYGAPSSGKTSICLQMAKSFKESGYPILYIDAEHALDLDYLKVFNVEDQIFVQPTYGEEALNIVREAIGKVGLIIVDSVAALVPKAEIDGDIGEANIGLQARMLGQALRILVPQLGKEKTSLIFINQTRSSIGTYGSPEITPGGNALKFYSSIRLSVKRKNLIASEDSSLYKGFELEVKSVKNKLTIPYKSCSLILIPTEGFDEIHSLFFGAVELGVITREGNSYFFEGQKLGGNRPASLQTVIENPDLQKAIYSKILEL
jgi:recombination protein RecA